MNGFCSLPIFANAIYLNWPLQNLKDRAEIDDLI